jgi:hypothetical protein
LLWAGRAGNKKEISNQPPWCLPPPHHIAPPQQPACTVYGLCKQPEQYKMTRIAHPFTHRLPKLYLNRFGQTYASLPAGEREPLLGFPLVALAGEAR